MSNIHTTYKFLGEEPCNKMELEINRLLLLLLLLSFLSSFFSIFAAFFKENTKKVVILSVHTFLLNGPLIKLYSSEHEILYSDGPMDRQEAHTGLLSYTMNILFDS